MPLDWIFGSKKKSEQEQSGQDGTLAKRDDGEDDFVMLSHASQSTSDAGGPHLPYSLAPLPTHVAHDNHQQEPSRQQEPSSLQQSFIHGVPFKLTCSGSFEDVESITTLHVRTTQHLAFIKQLLSSNSEYTFSLEDGVVRQ